MNNNTQLILQSQNILEMKSLTFWDGGTHEAQGKTGGLLRAASEVGSKADLFEH